MTPSDQALLDEFACAALTGISSYEIVRDMKPEHLAYRVYDLAEAMLAERKERGYET